MSHDRTKVSTVQVVQLRTEGLKPQMVVRRHGSRDPWYVIHEVVDGASGIDEVIRLADGDPNSPDEFAQWPFATTRHDIEPGFHSDDVAVILLVPDRKAGGDNRDFYLRITGAYELWDVQVLTRISVDILGHATYAQPEAQSPESEEEL